MELVLPMYNVHLYFSLKNWGKTVCFIHGKIQYCRYVNNSTLWSLDKRHMQTPDRSPEIHFRFHRFFSICKKSEIEVPIFLCDTPLPLFYLSVNYDVFILGDTSFTHIPLSNSIYLPWNRQLKSTYVFFSLG